MKKRLLAATLVAVLGLGAASADDDFFAIRKSIEIYGAAYKTLVGEYVRKPDAERLMQRGLEAMLTDMDPYTTFIDEADRTEAMLRRRGGYGGVGLSLGRRGGKVVVTAPAENARAYEQGLRTGDVLLSVAGRAVAELTLADVHELLRGEPGTAVRVEVQRTGQPEPLSFVLSRQKVDRQTVSHSGFINGSDIGYVRLDRFGRTSAAEMREALQALQKKRALSGFVLDLRNNPGGLLGQAVGIAGLFVPEGTEIVSMRGRTPETQRTYRNKETPLAPDIPLAVLTNDLSASASEIVAGAMQDLDRGVIVGETSFGKGLVQKVEQMPYNTAIKLTVAEYFTPSGRNIQAKDYRRGGAAIPDSMRRTYRTESGRAVRGGGGITPDVHAMPPDPGTLEQALNRNASFFFFANDYAARHESLPDGFEVNDALLADFREWLDGRDFEYESDAERTLQALRNEVEKEGYTNAVQGELSALRQALHRQKERAFEHNNAALKNELREAILARYLDRSGQRAALLEHDRTLQEAVQLLRDDDAYREVMK